MRPTCVSIDNGDTTPVAFEKRKLDELHVDVIEASFRRFVIAKCSVVAV